MAAGRLINSELNTEDNRRGLRRRRIGIAAGVGCAALLCIAGAVGVLVTVGTAFTIRWSLEEPQNVNISVDAPLRVAEGESVTLEVKVENTSAESQVLDAIDVSSEYLVGIAISHAEPPFVESNTVPFIGKQSFVFEQEISSGATLVVQFFGMAVGTGDFSGEIDVWIDSGDVWYSRQAEFVTRTVVEE